MNENKDLQVIYNYLINDVSRNDLRELIIYLKEFVNNGHMVDFKLTTEDFNDLCMNITTSHCLATRTSVNHLIEDLRAIDFFDIKQNF